MVSLITSGSQPSDGLLPKADQRKPDDNQNVGYCCVKKMQGCGNQD